MSVQLEEQSRTVSYTHLDVYKRQVLDCDDEYRKIVARAGELERQHDAERPVSYTHLMHNNSCLNMGY